MSVMRVGSLVADLPRRRFTVDEVYRMVEDGILDEDEHVELLDGELVVVSPQGPPHVAPVAELNRRLMRAYGRGCHVRVQMPLFATPHSLPEPDLAVAVGQPRDYRERHPGGSDVHLVIEVARTSQALDRRKAAVYAAAGVPVYWLVDLRAKSIDVFTKPTPAGRYERRQTFVVGQTVELPGLSKRWPVAELVE
jgi:Uma2 family endonuclease